MSNPKINIAKISVLKFSAVLFSEFYSFKSSVDAFNHLLIFTFFFFLSHQFIEEFVMLKVNSTHLIIFHDIK